MDCLFCKIVAGTIPATIIYRDDMTVIFNDINPQAAIHKVIIPHKHIATLNDLHGEDTDLMGHMIQVATKVAKQLNIDTNGYRLVMNCNGDGGQTVFHIHMHLLGGRPLHWPPG